IGLIAASAGFFRAEHALQLAEVEQANTEAVNRFLQRILVSPSQTGRVRDLTVEDMLREAASDTQQELAGQAQAQVTVRRMLAESFNVLDRQDLALEQIQLARELMVNQALVMPELSRRLDDQEIRAVRGLGRHEDSLALAEDFVRQFVGELGDDDSQIRFARLHKVTNLIALSRYEEALAIMETHFEAIPPPDPKQQNLGFGVLYSWANAYRGLGRFQEALNAAENTVEWLDHYPSVNLFNQISALNALASALSNVNQQDRAIEVYDEMLPLIERVYGQDSIDYIGAWVNLASIHRETGNLSIAQDTLEYAIDLMRRFPEAAGVDAELIVEMNLANLVNANGDAVRAEAMMRSVWPKMIDHWGPAHSTTLTLEYNLAELLSQQARYEEARLLSERTLASKRESLGDTHLLTLISMDNLAVALSGLGRGREAMELHDRALAVLTDQLSTEHPNALMIERHRMATLQNFAPERIEAGAIESLIQRHEQALGDEHFDTEKARALLTSD
ncbi:MAG: tetratricopeptide repeat protein, partial [Pseudomonadota bacterium]